MLNYNFFGIAASLLSVIAFIPYVRAILKKETTPSGASWWTWTLLALITVISSRLAGASWEVLLLPLWLCISQLGVALLSLKYGDNNWDLQNKLCVLGACLGIGLWLATGQPLIALGISIIADVCASIPNFRHAWNNPEEEDRLGWLLGWGSAVLEIFAISHWSFAESSWAIYFLINMTITLALVFRPMFQGRK